MSDFESDRYHGGRDSWFVEGEQRPTEPAPPTETRSIHEPARDTPVYEETDVLVVGGGPAGCAAAVAARRLGAEVTLVERYNHLGGLSTGGLVIWIDRMTDWEGRQIIPASPPRSSTACRPTPSPARRPSEWGSKDPAEVAHWRERLSAFHGIGHLVADDRPRAAEAASTDTAPGGRRSPAPARLGGRHRSSTGASCAARSSRARRAAGRSSPRSSSTRPATATSSPGPAPNTRPTSKARAPTSTHCMNTAWTWAGVDFGPLDGRSSSGDPDAHRALMKQGRESLGFFETPYVGWRDDVALFLGPRLSGYSGAERRRPDRRRDPSRASA